MSALGANVARMRSHPCRNLRACVKQGEIYNLTDALTLTVEVVAVVTTLLLKLFGWCLVA